MCALCGNPDHVAGGDEKPLASESSGDSSGPVAATTNETGDASSSTATTYAVAPAQSVQGHIGFNGDADWYRVDLVAGQTYTFAVVGTGLSTGRLHDSYLYLRNSAGTLLASDDDGGPGNNSTITFTASATGTYYLDVESYGNVGTGQYELSVTAGSKPSYDFDMGAGALTRPELSWSAPGTPATVTYGFRQSAATYTVQGTNIATFSQVSAAEMAAINTIMQFWSSVCNVTFVPVNPGGYTDNATILFGNYSANDGAGAFAFYPGSTTGASASGDVWLNLGSVSTTSLPFGSYSFFAIMHEVGHTIGLAHPGDYNAAPGVSITYNANAQWVQDSQQYSVMSYFDESFTGANYSGYADTPLMYDIYAAQQLYGANTTTRVGDTVYGFGSNAGAVYDFSSNTHPGFCIWDSGGIDTLNCAGTASAQLINLNPGTFSNVDGLAANVSIAIGAVIENAVGGSGSDTIIGNAAANTISGGGGNDVLYGMGGLDLLTGGTGADRFVFEALALADAQAASPVYDHVVDYSSAQGDQIDLSALLAQAFGAGQPVSALVQAVENAAGTFALLQIDTDGTGAGANWTTIAELDGLSPGNALNVVLNSSAPAGVSITVAGLVAPAAAIDHDFNGDGKTDLLWQNANGGLVEWQMNGNQINYAGIASMPADWHIRVSGDFNGDGKTDLLWQNDSGGIVEWQMNGNQLSYAGIASMPADWHIRMTGDFNGDGKTDLLWQNDNGGIVEWQMDGYQISYAGIASMPADWHIRVAGDFNGDGKTDLLWQNDAGGIVEWQMNGNQISSNIGIAWLPSEWHILATGDFNGDGKTDLLWQNANTAGIVEWQMNGNQISSNVGIATMPFDWHLRVTGDFNGDGKTDLLWQNDNGGMLDWQMNGNQISDAGVAYLPSNWHVLGAGDFNNDSKTDVLWQDANMGGIVEWQMNGNQVSAAGIATMPSDWHIIA